ncbi:MAG: L-aspartate oxidase [Eubacteriaceae bacterium]|nr:L-aspartate oxidase [Eubacteriaceae bacterium]MDD4508073.1 L-aspartate oxidase [Eubacteriaceae bacterium]
MKAMTTQTVIVGTGVSGLFCALNLPRNRRILMITKSDLESSDSFLAQGGICMLRDDADYSAYFEDTLKAGHYENRRESVDIMIRSSREIIADLVALGVDFERDGDGFAYTREGAHSRPRILFHEDITGKEITSKLLAAVKKRKNITLLEYTTMTDLLIHNRQCSGIVAQSKAGEPLKISAGQTVLASGGVGGLYTHSTNFRHLTGDAIALGKKYKVRMEHLDYVQIHPTTLYSQKDGRRFLISESVRGEGAVLLNREGHRFVDELLPRDVVTAAIRKQMQADHTPCVWLSLAAIKKEDILSHFPNIYKHCLEEGYDVTKERIPVVPAQHYFMGGVWVDRDSHTSMPGLYAVGETSCNGVHGANRLASNSLLESLVFAKRAALNIMDKEEQDDEFHNDAAVG